VIWEPWEPEHARFPLNWDQIVKRGFLDHGFRELKFYEVYPFVKHRRWSLAKVIDKLQVHVNCFTDIDEIWLSSHLEFSMEYPYLHWKSVPDYRYGKKYLERVLGKIKIKRD
jgi:hypothetical protein